MFAPLDTQRCFRGLLAAMSGPGTVHDVTPGLPLVLATLIDHEVRLAEVGDPQWETADFVLVLAVGIVVVDADLGVGGFRQAAEEQQHEGR